MTAWGSDLLDAYREHGWVIAPGPITTGELHLAIDALNEMYPTAEQFAQDPGAFDSLTGDQFAGLRLWPTGLPVLDDLVVHDAVISLAEQLVGTRDIRLFRAAYQAKYTDASDYTQVLHYDYPNHSLVVPDPDDVVGFFLYLSDVDESVGATRLVSDKRASEIAPDRTHLPFGDPLYDHEESAVGPKGSLLAYRSTTYHRGTPMTRVAGRRLTLGFCYGKPRGYHGYSSWPRQGEDEPLISFIRRASPRARALVGIPLPGSEYWTDATVTQVERRYGILLDQYR